MKRQNLWLSGLGVLTAVLLLRMLPAHGPAAPVRRGSELVGQRQEQLLQDARQRVAAAPENFDAWVRLAVLLCFRLEREHVERTNYGDRPQLRPIREPEGELADVLQELRRRCRTQEQLETYERLYRRACGYTLFPELHDGRAP